MTRGGGIQVVVCAGGLGSRIASWSRYVPKEFYPVDSRPGIVHVLEEIAEAGPAEVVIVCHPYYDAFTRWAQRKAHRSAPPQAGRTSRVVGVRAAFSAGSAVGAMVPRWRPGAFLHLGFIAGTSGFLAGALSTRYDRSTATKR